MGILYITPAARNIQPDDGRKKGPKYVVVITNIFITYEANKLNCVLTTSYIVS
jgi:hypothetical protein